MAWLNGYTKRLRLTITPLYVDENLINFPVLVRLNWETFDFTQANADGYDIRFTASNGVTLLKYSRERWDPDVWGRAEFWIKIPLVSSSEETIFYMYFRTENTTDGQDKINTWDNYVCVWHMNNVIGDARHVEAAKSTNLYKGMSELEPLEVEFEDTIAKGQYFTGGGAGGWLTGGDSEDVVHNPYTFEVLLSSPSLETFLKMQVLGTVSVTSGYHNILINDPIMGRMRYFAGSKLLSDALVSSYAKDLHDGYPHYIACLVDENERQKIFIDGFLDIEQERIPGTGLYMGWQISAPLLPDPPESQVKFRGIIDEIRVSNIARSAAWIKASAYAAGGGLLQEYESQSGSAQGDFFLMWRP